MSVCLLLSLVPGGFFLDLLETVKAIKLNAHVKVQLTEQHILLFVLLVCDLCGPSISGFSILGGLGVRLGAFAVFGQFSRDLRL